MSSWRGRPGDVPTVTPTTEPAGSVNRCGLCGRPVSLGAQCVCLTPGFSEMVHSYGPTQSAVRMFLSDGRIAAALERIATALERVVPDGRHTQQPSRPSVPSDRVHGLGPTAP